MIDGTGEEVLVSALFHIVNHHAIKEAVIERDRWVDVSDFKIPCHLSVHFDSRVNSIVEE